MTYDWRKVIADELRANGYDGFYVEDCCGCKLDDLGPCGEGIGEDCREGVFTDGPCSNCKGGKPCDFHIGPKAKETP